MPISTEAIESSLSTFNKIVVTQRNSITHLINQYKYSKFSQRNLIDSIQILHDTADKRGKIIICGIGKSYKIGLKLVATLNSLSIQSAILHPAEALHGDLGMVQDNDSLIFISASGGTPELLNLLNYIPDSIPIILLTCTRSSKLSTHTKIKSLLLCELPAPLKEDSVYGISAPTISTTLSLTLADATMLTLFEIIFNDLAERKKIFGERHPGGSIGEVYSSTLCLTSLNNTNNCASTVTPTLSSMQSSTNSLFSMCTPKFEFSESDTSDSDDFDNELISNIKQSNSIVRLSKMPHDELTWLRNISLYEFIIINDELAAPCASLLSVYKKGLEYDDWEEIKWRLETCFQKIKR